MAPIDSDQSGTLPPTLDEVSPVDAAANVVPSGPRTEEPYNEEEPNQEVDQYMSLLLERLRGNEPAVGGGPDASTASPPPNVNPDAPPTQSSDASTATAVSTATDLGTVAEETNEETEQAELEPLSELKSRGPAPEQSRDLASLRDLANMSVRGVLDTHSYQQLARSAAIRLALAVAAIAASFVLFTVSTAGQSFGAYTTALVALVAALMWSIQFLLTTRQMSQINAAAASAAASAASATAAADDE